MGVAAARAQEGLRLVPVGIGNTIALYLSIHLAMEKQRDREIALQRGEAIKDGGEGWRAGRKEGSPFLLMKSLQHIQCHKSYSTVTGSEVHCVVSVCVM